MTEHGEARTVSIVVPMLDEIRNVAALMARFRRLGELHPEYRFELVAVDDGSTDGTPQLLRETIEESDRVVLIELSRNFGSHYAISAGLQHARGACAIVVGADLQEPLELIGHFLERWSEGYEVVWGIRRSRSTSGLRSLPSRAFSRLFHRYSEISTYPAEGPSGVLCDRLVIDAVNELKERNRNVLGLIAWVGFRQTRVEYDQLPREAGDSKWSSRSLLKLAVDSFAQFSATPLRAAGLLGFLFASVGFAYATGLILYVVLGGSPPVGYPTVVVLILVLGGVQLVVLYVIGEYLWRTTDEARDRPPYVLRKVSKYGNESRRDAG